MPNAVSPEYVRAFADSMPDGYRDKYDAASIADHARISARRGDRTAQVGLVGPSGSGQTVVCVVAQDRPGLLSAISAAFVMSHMDVVAAEAFTRRRVDGLAEAVDLFWLRRNLDPDGSDVPTSIDVDEVTELLIGILEGRVPVDLPAEGDGAFVADTIVRFLDDEAGGLATLEVETEDRSGLLMALARALFAERVQIVRSEVRTENRRVYDRFVVVEFDGSPISPARRLDVQVAILGAVEPARRVQSGPQPSTTP
jgi:[protein-PII] uridylyltransferase